MPEQTSGNDRGVFPDCACGLCDAPDGTLHWVPRGRRQRSCMSQAARTSLPRIENDVSRRLMLGGFTGLAALLAGRDAFAEIAATPPEKPNGAHGGLLQDVLDPPTGKHFKMYLSVYPPGFETPPHHHPVPVMNYIVEGIAESRYADETQAVRFRSGDSYSDRVGVSHQVFRNLDTQAPLRFLLIASF